MTARVWGAAWDSFVDAEAGVRELCRARRGLGETSGGGECFLLGLEELVNALFGVVEHLVELVAAVGVVFGGGLGFDEAAVGEHDDVHVDGGAGVFFVAEVEQDVAVDDAYAGGGDHLFERRGLQGSGCD